MIDVNHGLEVKQKTAIKFLSLSNFNIFANSTIFYFYSVEFRNFFSRSSIILLTSSKSFFCWFLSSFCDDGAGKGFLSGIMLAFCLSLPLWLILFHDETIQFREETNHFHYEICLHDKTIQFHDETIHLHEKIVDYYFLD